MTSSHGIFHVKIFFIHFFSFLTTDKNGKGPLKMPLVTLACLLQYVAELSGELCQGNTEQWFFFTPMQAREARGGRPNRSTASGYWKATGSPRYVYSSDNQVIGLMKTMVFYMGKAPTGRKTKWKMNEYRAIGAHGLSRNATPKVSLFMIFWPFQLKKLY